LPAFTQTQPESPEDLLAKSTGTAATLGTATQR
jgi:hypothetical protein